MKELNVIQEELGNCQRCSLHTTRTNIVFGEGNPQARIMFIGEAPGHNEDVTGKPFIGKSGDLLTKMIEAIGLKRDDVYIANVVKCRPPNNRDPTEEEIDTCSPYLLEQIESVKPDLIVLVGLVSARLMLNEPNLKMKDIRGKVHFHAKLPPTLAIYHPAALLRNNNLKAPTWEDLQVGMAYIKEVINAKEDKTPTQTNQE